MTRLDVPTPTAGPRLAAVLLGALLVAGLVTSPAAAAGRTPAPSTLHAVRAQVQDLSRTPGQGVLLAPALAPVLAPKASGDCESFEVIECGQTLQGDITTQDCQLDDGTYVDFVFFDGVKGQRITATMSSTAFNPFLYLFTPDASVFVFDDDSGPGNSARIEYDIDETSPNWSLTPTPFDPDVTGPYTLTLQCDDSGTGGGGGGGGGGGNNPPPPPDGFFADPQYPDFWFKVTIEPPNASAIDGIHLAQCQEDTVCVAGAVPDRPELYIRILGPRPNGYLWPTVVRFTPSKVTVEIRQISSGESQTYTLDAVGPGDDNLSGTQDRMGFLP